MLKLCSFVRFSFRPWKAVVSNLHGTFIIMNLAQNVLYVLSKCVCVCVCVVFVLFIYASQGCRNDPRSSKLGLESISVVQQQAQDIRPHQVSNGFFRNVYEGTTSNSQTHIKLSDIGWAQVSLIDRQLYMQCRSSTADIRYMDVFENYIVKSKVKSSNICKYTFLFVYTVTVHYCTLMSIIE